MRTLFAACYFFNERRANLAALAVYREYPAALVKVVRLDTGYYVLAVQRPASLTVAQAAHLLTT